MDAKIRRSGNMLVAADGFLDENPITPPNAKGTAEIAILKASIAELATAAGNQDAGRAEWSGASDERLYLKFKLREELGEISAIAKVLDPEAHPTAKAQFKMSVNGSFASYINRGHAFLELIGPMKALFVEHGLAADFDEGLAETVVALEEAGAHTHQGRQAQMGGTAGMKEVAKRGVRAVRVLDSIVSPKLKKTNPALLAVWKAATKIERPPKKEKAAVPATSAATVVAAAAAGVPMAAATVAPAAAEGEPLAVEPRGNGTGEGGLRIAD